MANKEPKAEPIKRYGAPPSDPIEAAVAAGRWLTGTNDEQSPGGLITSEKADRMRESDEAGEGEPA